MPLDALGGRTIASLTDLLTDIGVTPVPMKDLEAHKVAQVRRHPPSMFFTPKPYVACALTISAVLLGLRYASVGVITAGNIAAAAFFALALTGTFTLLAAIFLDSFRVKLRAKAEWKERHPIHQPIPEPVLKVMRHVRERLPTAHFIYGELVQRRVVLDPYLVVAMPHCVPGSNYERMPWAGQQACLGIWEDDTIIQIAQIEQ